MPAKKSGMSDLFSGKLSNTTKPTRGSRKRAKPVEILPENVRELADVMVAGKKVEKEIEFKIRYSEQKVKDYCLRRFCERFAASGSRPGSSAFAGENTRFTFIQTSRINLTPEKAEAIRMLNVPIDEHTELRGIEINYEAIRQHKLEAKLRAALEDLGVSDNVIDEIFQPRIQLKESFFEILAAVVERSLGRGEKLEEKLYEVMKVLQPANQVKNADAPDLSAAECFRLVEKSEIAIPEDEEDLESAA